MDFRCVALITLWTLVSGPILGGAPRPAAHPAQAASAAMGKKEKYRVLGTAPARERSRAPR